MITNRKPSSKNVTAALVMPLLVLLLVGGSTLILAQPYGRGGDFEDRGPILDRIMGKLDLSPAQEEELFELMAESREEHRAQWEAVKIARRALTDQIHAEIFDEEAIREAAASWADIEEELAVDRARKFHEIQQILTPEQQAQMREMMETMRDFHEEWGGRHRGPRSRG